MLKPKYIMIDLSLLRFIFARFRCGLFLKIFISFYFNIFYPAGEPTQPNPDLTASASSQPVRRTQVRPTIRVVAAAAKLTR